jgi:hypothetical protein
MITLVQDADGHLLCPECGRVLVAEATTYWSGVDVTIDEEGELVYYPEDWNQNEKQLDKLYCSECWLDFKDGEFIYKGVIA